MPYIHRILCHSYSLPILIHPNEIPSAISISLHFDSLAYTYLTLVAPAIDVLPLSAPVHSARCQEFGEALLRSRQYRLIRRVAQRCE